MEIQGNKRPGNTDGSVPAYRLPAAEGVSALERAPSPVKIDSSFEAFGPHAPLTVKLAWNKAAEHSGTNGLGIGKNGMMTHIPAVLVMQAEQTRQAGSGDLFGDSVESAKSMAAKILDRLENPLTPESNSKIRDLHNEEILFYQAFLNNLKELGSGDVYGRWESQA